VIGRHRDGRHERARRERIDQTVIQILIAHGVSNGHVSRLVALRFRQQDMREVRAKTLLRAPGDVPLGVDGAGQMGVQVAALRHAAQEGAQLGMVVARRLEGGGGDDGVEFAPDPGDAQTDDRGQEEDDGNKDPASQGPPRSLQGSIGTRSG
jgi:uncharacterized protein YoaH (UPF0181 family)